METEEFKAIDQLLLAPHNVLSRLLWANHSKMPGVTLPPEALIDIEAAEESLNEARNRLIKLKLKNLNQHEYHQSQNLPE